MKAHTAGSSPMTHQPARLGFDTTKTRYLPSNTVHAYRQRTFLVAILGVVQDQRLDRAKGSLQVNHPADEQCRTTALDQDLGSIND